MLSFGRRRLSQSRKIVLFLPFFVQLLLLDPLLSFTTIQRLMIMKPLTFSHTKHNPIRLLFIQRDDDNDDVDVDDYYYYNDDDGEVVDDYYDQNSREMTERKPRGRGQQQNVRSEDYYIEEDNDDIDDDDDQRRGGYYQVRFNEEVDPSETQINWEACSDGNNEALVLLPPASVERPTAIIHFVGGTFFGSNPKIWYRSLLENIVRSTSTAIIVTPIPVTLFKNPLQHIQLSQKLKRAFQHAWFTVLEDEYGAEILRDIPLCGLGHSLGARLLTVLTTADENQPTMNNDKRRRQIRRVPPPYKSFCLVSFTNYGAKVGIPGVGALLKQSKRGERKNVEQRKFSNNNNQRRSDDKYRPKYYDDDDYGEYKDIVDEEWSELVEDLQETVNEQANRFKTALTPKSKDLEFTPTPDQLWNAVEKDARYKVNNTLIVQFDNDPIDQSSKLAQILHDTNSSDVKFARLRGTHLDPVSITTNCEDDRQAVASASAVAVGLGLLIEKTIKGNNKNREHKIAMRDLRQSIISYITDVVTK